MRKVISLLITLAVVVLTVFIFQYLARYGMENKILKEVISLLEAESRIAEVLVVGVEYDQALNKTFTTIKFLEYDVRGKPLEPRYFTFSGNVIQFQSLVIRFDDFYIKSKDPLRGKSAYLFWKVFILDGPRTKEYVITDIKEIPKGYKRQGQPDPFEKKLWEKFWLYALNSSEAKNMGIKNAQIEAPGARFVPGILYTIKIEHDGGMRIDAQDLPSILKGEYILE
jgi:hypothetical protein